MRPDTDCTIDDWRDRLLAAYDSIAEIDEDYKRRRTATIQATDNLYHRGDITAIRWFAIQYETSLDRKRARQVKS